MEPTLAFVAGGLLVAAKVLAAFALGFGIAWWRARKRLRVLERERQVSPPVLDRLEHLETGLDSLSTRLDQLLEGQEHLGRRLREASPVLPPAEHTPTPRPPGPSGARR